MISAHSCNSLVDEVHSLCLELVRTVQVGEDEDLCCVLHQQTHAQSILTHHLQPLQSILPMTERARERAEKQQVN